MIKFDQTLKNAQQVLTYLCFGFKLEYLLKVISGNFPKYLGRSLLDTLPTNFEYWYIPSKYAPIKFSKTV